MAKGKWNEEYILSAFTLAREGKTIEQIADFLGVTEVTVQKWRKEKPSFHKAIEQGQTEFKNPDGKIFSVSDYIYERLPDDLQPLWEKLELFEKTKSGVEKIDQLLKDKGKRVKQYLFIHAWISSGFILNKALRKVGISGRTFYEWKEQEPEFAELVNQVTFLMRCFIQDRLFEQAFLGDTQVLIFLAKTHLRKWGYSEKVDIDVNMNMTGEVKHIHTASLDLSSVPIELRRQFLEHVRNTKQIESIEVKGDDGNNGTA